VIRPGFQDVLKPINAELPQSTLRGVPITELNRDELMALCNYLSQENTRQSAEHIHDLNFIADIGC